MERQNFIPSEWRKNYLIEARAVARRIRLITEPGNRTLNTERFRSERNRSWTEITGVEANDSKFTIIIPIHDEAKFLPSVLSSFKGLLLPSGGNINVVFVTNNCSDNSQFIVEDFLRNISSAEHREIETTSLNPSVREIDRNATTVESITDNRGIKFSYINTSTPGKANALNIGNKIALDSRHKIGICLDANTFPESTAIARLYGETYSGTIKHPDGTAIVSGKYLDHESGEEENYYGMSPRHLLPSYISAFDCVVIGALSAWDTNFLASMGGVPSVKSDDFVMGIMALAEGRYVRNVSTAGTWRYISPTLEGRIKMLTRYVTGALQIAALNPKYRQIVNKGMFFMGGETQLVRELTRWADGDTQRLQALPMIIRLWKKIIKQGKLDFNQNPSDPTWEAIPGTK